MKRVSKQKDLRCELMPVSSWKTKKQNNSLIEKIIDVHRHSVCGAYVTYQDQIMWR